MAHGWDLQVLLRVGRIVDTTTHCRTSENSLDELVLAKRFGEIVLLLSVQAEVV